MKRMKRTLQGMLCSCILLTGASAQVELFGHLGAVYNQEFGDFVYYDRDGMNYGGATGHIGLDVGSNSVGFGIGAWGGSQIWSPAYYARDHVYGHARVDLSDLYFRYNESFDIVLGRFSNAFLRSDWLQSYTQGIGFSYNLGTANLWATWINDYATFGILPNRIASELTAYNAFPSSIGGFHFGYRDIIAGGANLDFGIAQINPFVHYFLDTYQQSNVLQAGAKAALILGSSGGVQSTSAAKFMWQNGWNGNTIFALLEEELRFQEIFSIGGGWYMIGNNASIKVINDNTRFYGRYLMPSVWGHYAAGTNTWYAFAGVRHERVQFDLLYASGSYSEFSAILSVRVLDSKIDFLRDGLGIDVGGGYVANGFHGSPQYHNALAFAKLVF